MNPNSSIKITIPQPCAENWSNMQAVEQGRYCNSCQKTVFDFNSYSDKQLQDYFLSHSGKICGRVGKSQLDRVITKETDFKSKPFLPQLFLSAALYLGFTNASGAQKVNIVQSLSINSDFKNKATPILTSNGRSSADTSNYIGGKVVDGKHEPMPFANVVIKNEDVLVISGMTDIEGNFNLQIPKAQIGSDLTIHVLYVGFLPVEKKVSSNNLPLKTEISLLDAEMMSLGGLIMVEYKPTFWQKIKNLFRKKSKAVECIKSDSLNVAEEKSPAKTEPKLESVQVDSADFKISTNIYPNPTKDFVEVELKTEGIVNFQLIDLNGKLVLEGQFTQRFNKVDISDQPEGIFTLKMVSLGNRREESWKIVKTK